MVRKIWFAILAAICTLAAPAQLAAHPHVWVKVRSELIFGADGKIAAVRHAWTFDEMYSAFAIQGVGTDGVPVEKALKRLGEEYVRNLGEYGYFTYLRAGGAAIKVGAARDITITLDDKKVMTLHYTAVLEKPVAAKPAATLKVVDPSYFVAFDYAATAAVKLSGAPAGCSLGMAKPARLTSAQKARLEAVQGTNESPGVEFGLLLATSAIAACP